MAGGVEVGVGYVDIRPDLTGFGRQLRTEVTRDVAAAGRDAATSMRASLGGAVRGVVAGVGAIKVGGLFKEAISSASALEEQMAATNAVFGISADGMVAWADQADKSLGLSKRAALEASSGFGNTFIQMGFTTEQAVEMSKRMVQLGVDMRSLRGGDITQMLIAQSAAFRGEFDSLQRYVPMMTAAAIEQRAMADTGKQNAKMLTVQEKAAATYTLMIEGAGVANGDFIRTQDDLANQAQKTAAEIENANATIGNDLIPLMKEWKTILRESIIPAFVDLFSTGGSATSWAAQIQNVVGDLVGFLVGALQQTFRLLANVVDVVPFGWGDDAADDLRTVADAADGFRDKMHASKAEMQAWATAGMNVNAAAKLLAPAINNVTGAMKDSIGPTQDSAKAAKEAAKAERDLLGAKRDVADAERGLAKAQADRDKAAKAFAILGTDTAADELAEADEALADARDSLADARDREADAHDRMGEIDAKAASGAATFAAAVTTRADAVKALNEQLGITVGHLGILNDPGNILKNIVPGVVLPPPGTVPLGPTVIAPPGPGDVSQQEWENRTKGWGGTTAATVNNNVTVNVTEPVPDPGLLGKAIAWAL